jgi:hypothetical protein
MGGADQGQRSERQLSKLGFRIMALRDAAGVRHGVPSATISREETAMTTAVIGATGIPDAGR